ncbi:MAG: acetolactate synthase [Dehalococcoidia bacterium]|nr:acetolactate synthase [Dehalococcoidia bacterium]
MFSLSGNQILELYDALLDTGIKLIHTRHEAAAGHMADAWGRLTDQPGVFLVTAGPGHANGAVAAGVARAAESPLLWLSGSSPLTQEGQGAFQELDQVGLAAPVCKAAWCAGDAQSLPQLIADALRLAAADPPGPVHITIPTDIQAATVTEEAEAASARAQEEGMRRGTDEAAEAIVAELADAERPLVLGRPALDRGQARRDFDAFLKLTGVPGVIVESPRGLNDPAQAGVTGALQQADVLLLLGSADYSVGFAAPEALAPGCRVAQIASPNEPAARTARFVLRTGVRRGLEQITAAASGRTWSRRPWWEARLPDDPRDAHQASSEHGIHALTVCHAVLDRLGPDDCVISDGGEFGQWARLATASAKAAGATVVLNGKNGSIGSAVPFSLAAKLARPNARVVAFSGDGGFGYHALELDTAVRYNLPVLVVVGNDARWGSEWHQQADRYGKDRIFETSLLPTRYDQLAGALGAAGEHVETDAELPAAVGRAYQALESGQPFLLDVRIASLPGPAPSP